MKTLASHLHRITGIIGSLRHWRSPDTTANIFANGDLDLRDVELSEQIHGALIQEHRAMMESSVPTDPVQLAARLAQIKAAAEAEIVRPIDRGLESETAPYHPPRHSGTGGGGSWHSARQDDSQPWFDPTSSSRLTRQPLMSQLMVDPLRFIAQVARILTEWVNRY